MKKMVAQLSSLGCLAIRKKGLFEVHHVITHKSMVFCTIAGHAIECQVRILDAECFSIPCAATNANVKVIHHLLGISAMLLSHNQINCIDADSVDVIRQILTRK